MNAVSAVANPSRPRPPRSAAAPGRPFARVEAFATLDAAAEVWRALEGDAPASPYQRFEFADAWFATVGAKSGAEPFIVVARDIAGQATALLPFALRRRGPVVRAEFFGGKDANFNLALFRAPGDWRASDVAALLTAAARQAAMRVDLYALTNQPLAWEGEANPLAALTHAPSPSFGHKSALPESLPVWLDGHFSKESQKKLRKKAKRLAELGPLAHRIARDRADADRILAAFLDQKRARLAAQGIAAANAYDCREAEAFLSRLAIDGLAERRPAMELHALTVGERIVAAFGALPGRARLCGLVVAFDGAPEVARCSPGELLIIEAVRSAIARGMRVFDLGVGEARYKSECCEADEPLFDSIFALTLRGRLAARLFLLRQRLKAHVKRSPRLTALSLRYFPGWR